MEAPAVKKPMNPKVAAAGLGGGVAVAAANLILDTIDMIYFGVTGDAQITTAMGASPQVKTLFTEAFRLNLSMIFGALGAAWSGYQARDV